MPVFNRRATGVCGFLRPLPGRFPAATPAKSAEPDRRNAEAQAN